MASEAIEKKRIIGLALLASAAGLVIVAVLIWTGVIPLAVEIRPWVAGALVAAGALDVLLAVRFLVASGA